MAPQNGTAEFETARGEEAAPLVSTARDGARLDVTINRPAKRNALSRATLGAIRSAFERHSQDETIKVAVLTGSGDKSFAAGGDLVELSALRSEAEAAGMSREARAALEAIRSFPVPVVAALNGDAIGGGAELAVACDMRVAAAHARIGFVQGRLAITTAWGGGIDLRALVGPSRALALLCRSDLLDAAAAREAGLVDEVGEPLAEAVARFVAPMLERSRQVLTAFKALSLAQRRGATREEMEEIETARFAETWVHDDHWAAADAILTRRPR